MSVIAPGSNVQLKAGGPIMTVRWIENDEAYCQWFDKTNDKGAKFAVVQLVLA